MLISIFSQVVLKCVNNIYHLHPAGGKPYARELLISSFYSGAKLGDMHFSLLAETRPSSFFSVFWLSISMQH